MGMCMSQELRSGITPQKIGQDPKGNQVDSDGDDREHQNCTPRPTHRVSLSVRFLGFLAVPGEEFTLKGFPLGSS